MRRCPLCNSPGVEHPGNALALATASCSNEKCFLHINRQDEANHHVLLDEWEGRPLGAKTLENSDG